MEYYDTFKTFNKVSFVFGGVDSRQWFLRNMFERIRE